MSYLSRLDAYLLTTGYDVERPYFFFCVGEKYSAFKMQFPGRAVDNSDVPLEHYSWYNTHVPLNLKPLKILSRFFFSQLRRKIHTEDP